MLEKVISTTQISTFIYCKQIAFQQFLNIINMYNPYYPLSSSQNQIENKFQYEIDRPRFPFLNTNQFLYQNIIATMNAQRKMIEEIDQIKSEVTKLKQQNATFLLKIQQLQSQKKQQEADEKKRKKIFRKNINCPFSDCSNKYSSKIALNSHIRAKHKRKQATNTQIKTLESQPI